MDAKKSPPQKITIGNRQSDEELMKKIFLYQQKNNIRYSSDAVRKLCEDALAINNALNKEDK